MQIAVVQSLALDRFISWIRPWSHEIKMVSLEGSNLMTLTCYSSYSCFSEILTVSWQYIGLEDSSHTNWNVWCSTPNLFQRLLKIFSKVRLTYQPTSAQLKRLLALIQVPSKGSKFLNRRSNANILHCNQAYRVYVPLNTPIPTPDPHRLQLLASRWSTQLHSQQL